MTKTRIEDFTFNYGRQDNLHTICTKLTRVNSMLNKMHYYFKHNSIYALNLRSYDEDRVGRLVQLTCGHAGAPSPLETIMFELHMMYAGFAPDLSKPGRITPSIGKPPVKPSMPASLPQLKTESESNN
jgi:hypothetical protein